MVQITSLEVELVLLNKLSKRSCLIEETPSILLVGFFRYVYFNTIYIQIADFCESC
jgi:hypothetical protein